LRAYLADELIPAFSRMNFSIRLIDSPTDKAPYLLADYYEDAALPTVLMYGHGDVVPGMEGEWRDGLDPWRATRVGDRVYGRGVADNKGQHSINMSALQAVREARGGRLGFNAKFIVEMGEEIGSPDLRQVCASLRNKLSADLFIASDGPRLSADRPTIFLGCRGGVRLHLDVDLREGAHHSGNWGGLLANPATLLANAIATLVDRRGRILLDALKPPPLSREVRAALAGVEITPLSDEPSPSPDWGEDGLSEAERVYAWNTLEVLAISAGDTANPANAIPGRAQAVLQLRHVVGTKVDGIEADGIEAIMHDHFARRGLAMVKVSAKQSFAASRTDIANPWVDWAAASIAKTTGKAPAVLPNFGGSLPNDVFADELGLPTIWAPHSYPGCNQHAPNEHILLGVAEEAIGLMAGLFWDLGEVRRPFRE
jgi:acetylornithine deacetylase/succinyl-diaminopimelate desuccinylase-like protein